MAAAMPNVTRFAPTPSGRLHLGHAHAALFAARAAEGGRFLLRIEDIDGPRCRPEFEDAILEDLSWLGLVWEEPVRRQSEHLADYAQALERLETLGVLYPCFCTRKDIAEEVARAAAAPHGAEGPLYPGTCRRMSPTLRAEKLTGGAPFALRIDVAKAKQRVGPISWVDIDRGVIVAQPERLGDAVLARKDIGTSYHLAVTVDDALQGVTLVTRGMDLFEASHLHRLLQALLDLPVPRWHHHRLITDLTGHRLAKRGGAMAIAELRRAGYSPEAVRALAGFPD